MPEHDLERAATQLLGEIQQQASRFAQDLFPQGPAGHKVLPRQALLEMVSNNWQDKSFREKLLERLAPPGPNGLPTVEEGIDTFVKLFRDAVLRSDDPDVQALTQQENVPQGPQMPDIPTADLLGVTPPQVPPTVMPAGAAPLPPAGLSVGAVAPTPTAPTPPPAYPGAG